MKGLRVGACVTVLDRETDRAVHAIAKPFIAVRGYAPNPRFGKDGKLVPDVYWAFAQGSAHPCALRFERGALLVPRSR